MNSLLHFLMLSFVLAGSSSRVCAAEPPHVIFLFADDMRADSLGALGNPAVKTPNLDTLVQRGFTMRNAYCFGGNIGAVCTPSRNMMLTGNAYFRWKNFTPPGMGNGRKGILAPGDGPNFPLSMKDAGYTTYHHGKKGNTAPLVQAKFEVNKYLANDEKERLSGEPGREIVDEAIAFWKAKNDKRPVFMYLAFANPHDPRIANEKYQNQYDVGTLPLPKNRLPVHPFDNGDLTVRDEQLLPWPRTEADLRRTHRDYYATITGLDTHIGRLFQTLKDLGQFENTLFVFSADQGIALGSHGLLGKQNLYEHSMKSPLVFAGPGVPKGASDALVHLFDIYPTVCELANAKLPANIDGRSFHGVLMGREKAAREQILLSYRSEQRAIRDARWKLLRYPAIDTTQLFDLQSDPDEMTNLAADPAHRERRDLMLASLAKLQKQYDDDQPLTVSNPKPAKAITAEDLRQAVKKK